MAFEAILKLVGSKDRESLLIANVNIGQTQVDLIVAFDKTYYVFEVKGTQREIRGDVNGPWSQKTSVTTWATIRNYYDQAIKAGYAVKDQLSHFLKRQVPYARAQLLFAPGLHPASHIPVSDHKVDIVSLATLNPFYDTKEANGCTIQEWKNFLAANHIQPVTVAGAALSPKLYHYEQLLATYNKSLIDTYKDYTNTFVPVSCIYNDKKITLQEMAEMAANNKNLLIAGPSGCSKTLMAKWLVMQLAKDDHIAIYIEAKYFGSLLGPVLDEEIKLLGAPSAAIFFDICKKLGKAITVIVDGYNECSHEKQKRIDRCLIALCARYSANTIIVSQNHQSGCSALNLELIAALVPDLEIKKQIAEKFSFSENSKKLEPLLLTATSGLEAMIIGDMNAYNLSGKSKFALFDYYVRKKLDTRSAEGTKTLSHIAHYLSGRISFVLTMRELEEIIEELDVPHGIIDILVREKLLTRYFDKFSFGHELFLHSYTAADIAKRLGHDPHALSSALTMPINCNSRMFLVGAITDEAVLATVLETINDPQLIVEFYLGEGGESARHWTTARFVSIFKKLDTEVQQLEFNIRQDGFRNVVMTEETKFKWSQPEMAFIYAIPELLLHGHYFEEVFQVARLADKTLEKEFARLLPEAKEKKIAIRSDLFAAIYCPFSDRGCGLSCIISTLHSGLVSLRMQNEFVPSNVTSVIGIESWSNGTLYTALTLCRFNEGILPLYPIILHCLTQKWKFLPYHLQIDLLEGAGSFWKTENERLQLIDAIHGIMDNNNPMMNTNAFDVLGRLGAFENEEAEEQKSVNLRLQKILSDKENPESWSIAVGLFYAHFDHPYSGAYSNAIYELPESERKDFMIMVVRGIDDNFFTTSAILSLAKFSDPGVGRYLERWLYEPPDEKSNMPQDALAVYLLVHCIFGQFGNSLDVRIGTFSTIRDNALSAVAFICYWINRSDLNRAEIKPNCEKAWSYLERDAMNLATDILYQSYAALRNHDIGYNLKVAPLMIHDVFPDRVARICRHAIQHIEDQLPLYHWHKKDAVITHAITFLEAFGNTMDIPLLKQMADHSEFGSHAIKAIKKLQEKNLI